MLLIDRREGSSELAEPLAAAGLPVFYESDGHLPTLAFGDVAFEGKGVGGSPLDIGVEFKKLPDLVASLRTGRLSGWQAPGMLGPNGIYDYGYLLVEGQWRVSSTGLVVQPVWRGRKQHWLPVKGNMPASEMLKRLMTLEAVGGFHVAFTGDRSNTLAWITACYHWWVDKPLDAHASHLTEHHGGITAISDFRATVQRFPGIGRAASAAVEKRFGGSLQRACNSSVSEWASIETVTKQGKKRRLGTAVAQKVVDFINGRK